jgi:hypothetical protein
MPPVWWCSVDNMSCSLLVCSNIYHSCREKQFRGQRGHKKITCSVSPWTPPHVPLWPKVILRWPLIHSLWYLVYLVGPTCIHPFHRITKGVLDKQLLLDWSWSSLECAFSEWSITDFELGFTSLLL